MTGGALAPRIPGRILPAGFGTPSDIGSAEAAGSAAAPPGALARAWDKLAAQPIARGAFIGLLLLVAACVFLPFVLPWGANEIDRSGTPAAHGASLSHPLGTDGLGRDQLSRVLSAGRVSLGIGFSVAALSLVIGSCVGLVAGYFGGRVDSITMWFVNVLMSVPPLPLLIGLSVLVASPDSHVGALVRGISEPIRIVFVLASLGWMGFSRVIRAQVLSLSRQEFVEAAEAMGATHARRMFLHVLPGCMPTMVVFVTFGVSGAILGESFLSFLGVGVNPPTATWGNMLSEASELGVVLSSWWLILTPSLAILATVLVVNFLGEGLRVALDPRVGD